MKISSRLALSILFVSLLLPGNNGVMARGGGGGGGGGGHFGGGGGHFGGYGGDVGRGDFGRDDFNRDFGGGMRSGFDRGFDQGPVDRGSAFGKDMPSDFGRPGDNGVHDYAADHGNNFAADAGYGKAMGGAADRGLGNNRTERVSPTDLAARGDAVRGNYNRRDDFNRNWWRDHPNAWYNRNWDNGWAWQDAGWGDLAGWWGVGYGDPIDYDYGDNISYGNDGNVYYGSDPMFTQDDYYQQSENLANSAPVENVQPTTPAAQMKYSKEWKPLGVYALVQNGQAESSSQIMQLCTNKAGIIRGNYFNALTNQNETIRGAVDKKGQRASWTVGSNSKVVYDTGISNLLKPQSPILVHYSKSDTQQWMLVRLQNPSGPAEKENSQTAGS